MKKTKQNLIISLILNLLVVLCEVVAVIISLSAYAFQSLQFYTQDSNIFAGVACGILAVYQIRCLRRGNFAIPQWVRVLKYMASCCVALTFLVVITVLAPTMGPNGYYYMLLTGSNLFMHFLCPILTVVSFLFFEKEPPLCPRHILYAILPTLAYACTTALLNLLRVMEGPYMFLLVYQQPWYLSVMWFFVIDGMALLLAWLLFRGSRALAAKNSPAA